MIRYTNRQGKTYILHRDKRGQHYFSQNVQHFTLRLPAGHEIYEHPNGQVFLRAKQPPLWEESEVTLLRQYVDANPAVLDAIIDVRGKVATIWVSTTETSQLSDWKKQGFRNYQDALAFAKLSFQYTPELRFTKEGSNFLVERYCYRSSVDDWIGLDRGTLKTMAILFIRHLNQPSLYELV